MDIKSKNNHKWNKMILLMLFLCLAAAALYTAGFPSFKSIAAQNYENPLEQEEFVRQIYKSGYVLYQNLYEKIYQKEISFADLYIEAEIVQEKMLDIDNPLFYSYNDGSYEIQLKKENSRAYEYDAAGYWNEEGEYIPWEESEYGGIEDYEARAAEDAADNSYRTVSEADANHIRREIMRNQEADFNTTFNEAGRFFDYYIADNKTGKYISNTAFPEFTNADAVSAGGNFGYWVQIAYDENGNLETVQVLSNVPHVQVFGTENGKLETVQVLSGQEKYDSALHKAVTRVGLSGGAFAAFDMASLEEATGIEFRLLTPKNCTITFGLTQEALKSIRDSWFWNGNSDWWEMYHSYRSTGIQGWLWTFLLLITAAAFFLPVKKKLWESKIFRPPFEVAAFILWMTLMVAAGNGDILIWTMNYCEGSMAEDFQALTGKAWLSDILAYLWIVLLLFAVFAATAYAVLCLREIRDIGIREYFKKRSYIYRIFPYIKRKLKQAYTYFTKVDVSTGANQVIIRLLIVNGILVSFFTLFWFAGIFAVTVYSVILYFIMRKYVSDMKKKYEILLKAANQIAEGNLNVKITEDLGMFEPFKPQIEKIQDGFKTAVEEEVKSQKMKTELITNVSHDLKTPLTAIITYINLLKEEDVTEEQRKEYLDTLERKSLRLKVLIEDLFEVSKANSRNVSLNPVDVDIVDLLKQVNFELEDKFLSAGLEIRFQSSEEKIVLKLDSQKTYRIYENLMGNVVKYAMPGTRVYVNVQRVENKAAVEIKNISASEIECAPEELTERFVRGDVSRNTEGSGLGLAIAKSFVELQGGKMNICLDGDLFKVITEWPSE